MRLKLVQYVSESIFIAINAPLIFVLPPLLQDLLYLRIASNGSADIQQLIFRHSLSDWVLMMAILPWAVVSMAVADIPALVLLMLLDQLKDLVLVQLLISFLAPLIPPLFTDDVVDLQLRAVVSIGHLEVGTQDSA